MSETDNIAVAIYDSVGCYYETFIDESIYNAWCNGVVPHRLFAVSINTNETIVFKGDIISVMTVISEEHLKDIIGKKQVETSEGNDEQNTMYHE